MSIRGSRYVPPRHAHAPVIPDRKTNPVVRAPPRKPRAAAAVAGPDTRDLRAAAQAAESAKQAFQNDAAWQTTVRGLETDPTRLAFPSRGEITGPAVKPASRHKPFMSVIAPLHNPVVSLHIAAAGGDAAFFSRAQQADPNAGGDFAAPASAASAFSSASPAAAAAHYGGGVTFAVGAPVVSRAAAPPAPLAPAPAPAPPLAPLALAHEPFTASSSSSSFAAFASSDARKHPYRPNDPPRLLSDWASHSAYAAAPAYAPAYAAPAAYAGDTAAFDALNAKIDRMARLLDQYQQQQPSRRRDDDDDPSEEFMLYGMLGLFIICAIDAM